ncbi:hypothetical protein WJX84_010335 [Apatococcus fuscideae]|uniref:C3H1-type domain-containing protein n=1 Tax=Apatococcus fuscideae TaxID=2026836 RepID=A0AAW1T3D1_9CHLO
MARSPSHQQQPHHGQSVGLQDLPGVHMQSLQQPEDVLLPDIQQTAAGHAADRLRPILQQSEDVLPPEDFWELQDRLAVIEARLDQLRGLEMEQQLGNLQWQLHELRDLPEAVALIMNAIGDILLPTVNSCKALQLSQADTTPGRCSGGQAKRHRQEHLTIPTASADMRETFRGGSGCRSVPAACQDTPDGPCIPGLQSSPQPAAQPSKHPATVAPVHTSKYQSSLCSSPDALTSAEEQRRDPSRGSPALLVSPPAAGANIGASHTAASPSDYLLDGQLLRHSAPSHAGSTIGRPITGAGIAPLDLAAMNRPLSSHTAGARHAQAQGFRGLKNALWKTAVCLDWKAGKCNKPAHACNFAHGEADKQRTHQGGTVSLAPRITDPTLAGIFRWSSHSSEESIKAHAMSSASCVGKVRSVSVKLDRGGGLYAIVTFNSPSDAGAFIAQRLLEPLDGHVPSIQPWTGATRKDQRPRGALKAKPANFLSQDDMGRVGNKRRLWT